MSKEIILTGLRSNGEYHLGNYIGALLPLINFINEELSSNSQIQLFIPDLHSFTTPIDFSQLSQQTKANLKLFVASGIPLDKDNVLIYRQSQIPAHSELTWILNNFASFGELSRMVEFKDKASKLSHQQISVGLFTYPILMAADILLYDAKWVPVGDDQRQHLEFCRKLAQSFNHQFNQDIFVVPASYKDNQDKFKRKEAPRIMSLKRPEAKMSKSIDDPSGTIMLSDDNKTVTKKIMSATTDTLGKINYDWQNQPGITNLLTILAYLENKSQADINQQWQGSSNYQQFKAHVAEVINQTLSQIQADINKVNQTQLDNHLKQTEAKLNLVANAKLTKVQQVLGLRE